MFLMFNTHEAGCGAFLEPCYKEIAKVKDGYTVVKDLASKQYLETLGYDLVKEVPGFNYTLDPKPEPKIIRTAVHFE